VVLYILLLRLEILALFSQCSGWDAQQVFEMAVEVALVSKADGMGDLSNRPFFLEQQRFGTLNATGNHILMGSLTGRLLEQAAEVRDAHAEGGGQFLQGNVLVEPVIDIVLDDGDLALREVTLGGARQERGVEERRSKCSTRALAKDSA